MLLDRFGRVAVLWATMAAAGVGVLLIVFGGSAALVVLGIVLWGFGASLGFPVGMSAAADDPVHAAARVSVVSTIGYTAFLAGPPLLGLRRPTRSARSTRCWWSPCCWSPPRSSYRLRASGGCRCGCGWSW